MTGSVYRAVITLPLLARAESAERLREQIQDMSLDDLMFEVAEGTDMIAGSRSIDVVEHVPREDIERELRALGNDGTFFEDTMEYMGDDHGEDEGKDQD